MRRRSVLFLPLLLALVFGASGCADDNDNGSSASPTGEASSATVAPTRASGELILASTTSTQDSGLFDALLPAFEEASGYSVRLIAVGSGQAIEQASRGDADVVFAHSPDAEKKMIASGDGEERILVMHNDFIIVGKADDPAAIKASPDAPAAMAAIAAKPSPFISRGDNSGTHALELKLWEQANIDPTGQSWYEESGQGMGPTLQIANQRNAYTISDRATFLAQEENLDLVLLYEGDPALLNYYHVIVVNPDEHPDVNDEAARAFAAFVTSAEGQRIIAEFGVEEYGEPLFFPDAGKPDPTA